MLSRLRHGQSLFLFLSNRSTWLDCELMRRTVIRGSVATPLSWETNPLDRKLCVLAFRRVCPLERFDNRQAA
jgi:hypothetical protein